MSHSHSTNTFTSIIVWESDTRHNRQHQIQQSFPSSGKNYKWFHFNFCNSAASLPASVDSVIDRWDLRGEPGSSVCSSSAPAFTLQDIYRDSSGVPAGHTAHCSVSDGISLTSLSQIWGGQYWHWLTMNVSPSWQWSKILMRQFLHFMCWLLDGLGCSPGKHQGSGACYINNRAEGLRYFPGNFSPTWWRWWW